MQKDNIGSFQAAVICLGGDSGTTSVLPGKRTRPQYISELSPGPSSLHAVLSQ
jgi:hypothetical protein